MNAVEIEQAVSDLARKPFDRDEFPFAFLEAFGNKATTIKKLRAGASNASDVPGGVLQRTNIHLAVCAPGAVGATLAALKASPRTASGRAKFILATDGEFLEAEDLALGETLACAYGDFANQFGFFLPLAGITTVRQIRNNPIDIQATSRLNRLYVELLKENPDWDGEARRHDLNQLMARLIFCFFAEDTGIFFGERLFTRTLEQMSDVTNTHEVIAELFRAMDMRIEDRKGAKLRPWAEAFPYVNGGLFRGAKDMPRFSRAARSYLLHAGNLDWKAINPDIFGSMIQAVADDAERGELGMHYTSVPNILKVLNPLFLDDLRAQLEAAGDNGRKLLNLRKRIANIRVFDPACGSGNFLVIAYIHMREIEAEIVRRRKDDQTSWIKLENFYGIELKDFAAEIARLALLIAEFQCDVRMIGQVEARLNVLPLKKTGQIHRGNALRLDWLTICPPVKPVERPRKDFFDDVPEQLEVDFDAVEPETYICGNPPYKGSQTQTAEQKEDLQIACEQFGKSSKQLDYVAGWFIKGAHFNSILGSTCAFVSTNSICQGRIVPIVWPAIYSLGQEIVYAHTSFRWANLAKNKAGVTVVVAAFGPRGSAVKKLYAVNDIGQVTARSVSYLNAYLVPTTEIIIESRREALSLLPEMHFGNMPVDGGALLLNREQLRRLAQNGEQTEQFVRKILGSAELIHGLLRYCLWIDENQLSDAMRVDGIKTRITQCLEFRTASKDAGTRTLAGRAHQFRERKYGQSWTIIVPSVSSEIREYLPVGLLDKNSVVSNLAFALYDAPLWNMALIASRIHLVWIATVCGKLETRYRYSNTLGWNTFPVPPLTEKNKADLTRCAQDILLAREAHFPQTIADLYDPKTMPANLREAHERNDEVLERIYIGRRFRNDTERLEKLFELYTKMTAGATATKGTKKRKGAPNV